MTNRATSAPAGGCSATGGFTLIELMLSLALVAMMVVALTHIMLGFGESLNVVREQEQDLRLTECMVDITRSARHGWFVEEPSEDRVRVTDAFGGTTEFYLQGAALNVVRPDGAKGVVLGGVDGFDVAVQTMRRLRPEANLDSSETWFQHSQSAGTSRALVIEKLFPFALGFSIESLAPDWVSTVADVEEEVVEAALGQLVLPLVFIPPVKDLGTGLGDAGKLNICHVPPGNAENASTLKVGDPAIVDHMAHGDYLGICVPEKIPPDAAPA